MSPALATIWWTKSQSEPAPRPHPLRETGRLERELEVAGGRVRGVEDRFVRALPWRCLGSGRTRTLPAPG
jgi:hypothetical protein